MKLIKCKFLCLYLDKIHLLKINFLCKTDTCLCFCFFLLAGSYVALTVLGRPPGLAQIPLSEAESEMLGVSISSPNSPAAERPYSPQDRLSSTQPPWVLRTSVASISCLLKLPFFFLTSLPSCGLSLIYVFLFLLNIG